MAARKRYRKKPKPAPATGWNTTDEDEINRRIARAAAERFRVTSAGGDNAIYSAWCVAGDSKEIYSVEIRSLTDNINSCSCMDYQINGLGTCKHIEAVRRRLRRRKRAERDAGVATIQIYLDRRDMSVHIMYPAKMRRNARAKQAVSGFFDASDSLKGDLLQTMNVLKARLAEESSRVRAMVRISADLELRLQQLQLAADLRVKRRDFEKKLRQGQAGLNVVKLPLFPYQQAGMQHLAFTGRALLADEMGLGKTVQAIAASELLDRLHGIKKVLVVAPASLKSEWLEQIEKFSDRQATIVQGMRRTRYKRYQQPAFFYLANYEQILYDKDFINETLKPDLIILDEAQRIKNWKTKTANAIKKLQSPYAFVLTGTPLENRIDEIYSLVQFLDPMIFGPLFRFNRDFHQLDEAGNAIGYKNLDQLHERLRPIMLRRRKDDVEGELPERSINNYFVPMTTEQVDQYSEYEEVVARMASIAKSRPLKKEERERLLIALSCMRMACDTPFILDKKTRLAPKLDELEKLLSELLIDPDCKILVFSEWERMLVLLAERLSEAGIDYAWHTGSLSQKRRREEINRFKQSPDCRAFLATDSAATGLNLQIARVVVNLDLPWNPAKLEQRIARAWRKHQKHPVSVINLVSEHTIEHRMLTVLRHKTDLADEVIDGAGKVSDMPISVGKGSFMEKLGDLLGTSEPKKPPLQRVIENIVAEHSDNLAHLEQRGDFVLAVVDEPNEAVKTDLNTQLQAHYGEHVPQLEMLDRATYEMLQRLAAAGVIQFAQPAAEQEVNAQAMASKAEREKRRRDKKAGKFLQQAAEKLRMSRVLAEGGFMIEALAPASDALDKALSGLAIKSGIKTEEPPTLNQIGKLQASPELPDDLVANVAMLRHERAAMDEQAARNMLATAEQLVEVIAGIDPG